MTRTLGAFRLNPGEFSGAAPGVRQPALNPMCDIRVRVLLELDPSVEPIGGVLSVEGGLARPFSGWMALARELDAALASTRPQCPSTNSESGQ